MAIRCYIPTTLTALRSSLTDVRAVAPDEASRGLRGEESESAEFDALCIAAAIAADAALRRFAPAVEGDGPAPTDADSSSAHADSGSAGIDAVPEPRVVVAYDAPDSSLREPLTEGFELIELGEVDMESVASFHLDDDAVWDEAVSLAQRSGPTAAGDRLGESDLLWYDATELDHLLDHRG